MGLTSRRGFALLKCIVFSCICAIVWTVTGGTRGPTRTGLLNASPSILRKLRIAEMARVHHQLPLLRGTTVLLGEGNGMRGQLGTIMGPAPSGRAYLVRLSTIDPATQKPEQREVPPRAVSVLEVEAVEATLCNGWDEAVDIGLTSPYGRTLGIARALSPNTCQDTRFTPTYADGGSLSVVGKSLKAHRQVDFGPLFLRHALHNKTSSERLLLFASFRADKASVVSQMLPALPKDGQVARVIPLLGGRVGRQRSLSVVATDLSSGQRMELAFNRVAQIVVDGDAAGQGWQLLRLVTPDSFTAKESDVLQARIRPARGSATIVLASSSDGRMSLSVHSVGGREDMSVQSSRVRLTRSGQAPNDELVPAVAATQADSESLSDSDDDESSQISGDGDSDEDSQADIGSREDGLDDSTDDDPSLLSKRQVRHRTHRGRHETGHSGMGATKILGVGALVFAIGASLVAAVL